MEVVVARNGVVLGSKEQVQVTVQETSVSVNTSACSQHFLK
jgi:hypothetical protein